MPIFLTIFFLLFSGCAKLFGWNIHAPGILSQRFSNEIHTEPQRIGLYLSPESMTYQSKNRGGRMADPQTYYLGEAFAPMMVEGFQAGFEEFILIETEPNPALLKQYAVPYFVTVDIKEFNNRVTLKGQAVQVVTETVLYDSDLNALARFETKGSSDAQKVFAKKGGPEVNLNAAIENNVSSIVLYLQDYLKQNPIVSDTKVSDTKGLSQ